MPAPKYDEPIRLPGQWWPQDLLDATHGAARRRGWNYTQWLQEAARKALRAQEREEKRQARQAT